MAQPTSFMHQHTYTSQFPTISALTVVKKYEYGYLLKKLSLVSDLIFFLIRKRFWLHFKAIWRAAYRKGVYYRKTAASFRDKYKPFVTRPELYTTDARKPSPGLIEMSYYLRWFKYTRLPKIWRERRRRPFFALPIRYLHIESFRTLCYQSYFYIYINTLRYK